MFVQSKTYLKWQVAWDKACVIFPYVLLATKIFCHTYISLYRFLYIYWYIMLSNYASIKNNWYKSSVTRATNAIGRVVLWRHDSSFPSSLCFFPSSLAAILGRVDTGPIWWCFFYTEERWCIVLYWIHSSESSIRSIEEHESC